MQFRPPLPQEGHNVMQFDGVTSALRLSPVERIVEVSMWVYVHLQQRGPAPWYLLDARGAPYETDSFSSADTSGWSAMFRDGSQVCVEPQPYPRKQLFISLLRTMRFSVLWFALKRRAARTESHGTSERTSLLSNTPHPSRLISTSVSSPPSLHTAPSAWQYGDAASLHYTS